MEKLLTEKSRTFRDLRNKQRAKKNGKGKQFNQIKILELRKKKEQSKNYQS